jgi:hypothetical protein
MNHMMNLQIHAFTLELGVVPNSLFSLQLQPHEYAEKTHHPRPDVKKQRRE